MKQKPKDLILILIIYMIALGTAVLTLKYAPIENILWKTALADVVATTVVFIFSMVYNNSSVYDPYWSAAPVFIVFYWLLQSGQTDFMYKMIWVLIIIWGTRLTWNWILRWDGMEDEDWRYVNIRNKTGKWYWPASFFSIHLLPTAWVFAGLVPVYYVMYSPSSANTWIAVFAFLVTMGAIHLEKTADDQLRHFIKSRHNKNERIQTGVWIFFKYPNYIGEMSFWWGLFFFAIAADRSLWWTFFGPASITLLFLFISIPMMKKRLKGKVYN